MFRGGQISNATLRAANCQLPGCRVDFLEAGKSRCLEVGKSRILGPGIPEFWDLEIQTFGIQQIKKNKILKIQICSAQNVGKVWISREKILPALFGAFPGHFLHGPEKSKKI